MVLLWLASLHHNLVAQIYSPPSKAKAFTRFARPVINLPVLVRQTTEEEVVVVVVPLLLLSEVLLWVLQQALLLEGI